MLQRATLEDDKLLAEATFRVGFVAPDGRPRRMPAPWRAAFAEIVTEGTR
jgi:acyl-CoA thioester hydrolase